MGSHFEFVSLSSVPAIGQGCGWQPHRLPPGASLESRISSVASSETCSAELDFARYSGHQIDFVACEQ